MPRVGFSDGGASLEFLNIFSFEVSGGGKKSKKLLPHLEVKQLYNRAPKARAKILGPLVKISHFLLEN